MSLCISCIHIVVNILIYPIQCRDKFVRQFLVSWISLLDSVPDSQMVQHLPEFLDPLFNILDDPCPEISTLCDNLLGEFLSHIIDKPEVSLDRSQDWAEAD